MFKIIDTVSWSAFFISSIHFCWRQYGPLQTHHSMVWASVISVWRFPLITYKISASSHYIAMHANWVSFGTETFDVCRTFIFSFDNLVQLNTIGTSSKLAKALLKRRHHKNDLAQRFSKGHIPGAFGSKKIHCVNCILNSSRVEKVYVNNNHVAYIILFWHCLQRILRWWP